MIQISEAFREKWIALRADMDDYPEKIDWKNAEHTMLTLLDKL